MIQIVDIDGDGSCLEAWCSLETVNPLFVPGAHSKLSWVSVDLTEVMKWRDGKRKNPVFLSSLSSLNTSWTLSVWVFMSQSISLALYLDAWFSFAIVYQTPNMPRYYKKHRTATTTNLLLLPPSSFFFLLFDSIRSRRVKTSRVIYPWSDRHIFLLPLTTAFLKK